MLGTKERRPTDLRPLRGSAIFCVLREAGAIRECQEHGWMQDSADPDARERAFDIARRDPPQGRSRRMRPSPRLSRCSDQTGTLVPNVYRNSRSAPKERRRPYNCLLPRRGERRGFVASSAKSLRDGTGPPPNDLTRRTFLISENDYESDFRLGLPAGAHLFLAGGGQGLHKGRHRRRRRRPHGWPRQARRCGRLRGWPSRGQEAQSQRFERSVPLRTGSSRIRTPHRASSTRKCAIRIRPIPESHIVELDDGSRWQIFSGDLGLILAGNQNPNSRACPPTARSVLTR